jgi:putative acetyltransferase
MQPSRLKVRTAVPGDAAALCSLSVSAIRRSAAGHYTASQIEAWVGRRTVAAHRIMIESTTTLVAVAGNGVAGFAAIALAPAPPLEAGEVDQLFVSPSHDGRGVARLLLNSVESVARDAGLDVLVTHASWRSVPVFERLGYEQVEIETVQVGDEELTRAYMRKQLAPADDA